MTLKFLTLRTVAGPVPHLLDHQQMAASWYTYIDANSEVNIYRAKIKPIGEEDTLKAGISFTIWNPPYGRQTMVPRKAIKVMDH